MKPELSITTCACLLKRIKTMEDEDSWREFARIYSELIRRLALKASLTEHEAEEVVQEVLISVARNITTFNYDPKISSFKRWLSIITRWRITSQQRKRLRLFSQTHPATERTDSLHHLADPAGSTFNEAWSSEWTSKLIETGLERVKKRIKPKHYQIYFLHVLKEKPVADVCRRLKVNPGQVYLAKLRVGRLLEKELRALRKTM
jgi:RNA polymerase sigma-70 factor (ECF subfamily)